VEQGRINVDVDVNTYLRQIRVQQTDQRPITVRHLLTHTAGFDSDQRAVGGSATSGADWLSTSTATDMAHFMIAQLGDGRYADARILEAAAIREMHREQFSYAPDQPGMTFGCRQAFPPGRDMDSVTH